MNTELALRSIIANLDFDLHKHLNFDEETGENHYPLLAAEFEKLQMEDS